MENHNRLLDMAGGRTQQVGRGLKYGQSLSCTQLQKLPKQIQLLFKDYSELGIENMRTPAHQTLDLGLSYSQTYTSVSWYSSIAANISWSYARVVLNARFLALKNPESKFLPIISLVPPSLVYCSRYSTCSTTLRSWLKCGYFQECPLWRREGSNQKLGEHFCRSRETACERSLQIP